MSKKARHRADRYALTRSPRNRSTPAVASSDPMMVDAPSALDTVTTDWANDDARGVAWAAEVPERGYYDPELRSPVWLSHRSQTVASDRLHPTPYLEQFVPVSDAGVWIGHA